MIDISNAHWEITKQEQYALDWFNANGFDVKLEKQYLSKTKFTVTKNGLSNIFEVPKGNPKIDMKSFMKQFEDSFDLLCKLQGK